MKTLWTFATTWITATLLLLWLGDYNMYLVDRHGSITIKEHANSTQRLVFSILFAAAFSFVNTGVLWGLQKLSGHGRKHLQE